MVSSMGVKTTASISLRSQTEPLSDACTCKLALHITNKRLHMLQEHLAWLVCWISFAHKYPSDKLCSWSMSASVHVKISWSASQVIWLKRTSGTKWELKILRLSSNSGIAHGPSWATDGTRHLHFFTCRSVLENMASIPASGMFITSFRNLK